MLTLAGNILYYGGLTILVSLLAYNIFCLIVGPFLGRRFRKEAGDWDTTAWAHFNCPRCGAEARQFCKLIPWKWKGTTLYPARFNCHKERVTKAMLLLDGVRRNVYEDDYKDKIDLDW